MKKTDKDEWHELANVQVQRICDNSLVFLPLYMKIIDNTRYYKVENEHVRQLRDTEYVNGFGYNAVTASYRMLL